MSKDDALRWTPKLTDGWTRFPPLFWARYGSSSITHGRSSRFLADNFSKKRVCPCVATMPTIGNPHGPYSLYRPLRQQLKAWKPANYTIGETNIVLQEPAWFHTTWVSHFSVLEWHLPVSAFPPFKCLKIQIVFPVCRFQYSLLTTRREENHIRIRENNKEIHAPTSKRNNNSKLQIIDCKRHTDLSCLIYHVAFKKSKKFKKLAVLRRWGLTKAVCMHCRELSAYM